MKNILYFIAMMFFIVSCFDDKGNYDYKPINEMKIVGFGDRDTTLQLLYELDTLRITAGLDCSLDKDIPDNDYIWRWELENGGKKQIVSESRSLVLPIDMTPGKYTLHLRIKDQNTGLAISTSEGLEVVLTHSKGLLVLGDRENGDVQLDMIAMIDSRKDTIIFRDMLKETQLPAMKNAISVFHTGENDEPENVRLWIMSETGSYYLESATMQGDESNNINKMFYTSLNVPDDAYPVECFPRIAIGQGKGTTNGFVRGFRLSDGSFIFTNHLLSEIYGNPINRLRTDPEKLIKLYPGCIYASRYMKAIMVYDEENDRFLGSNRPDGEEYLTILRDMPGDRFPFDQRRLNRKLVYAGNTRNPINADKGRSYTLMKSSTEQYFIYGFYIGSRITNNWSTKIGYWRINKDIATEIDNASKFMFSSTSQLLYYIVGNKVYCYSFNQDNEKCEVVADFGDEEITWWDTDMWTEITFDYIWIATYDPIKGGTIYKYQESDDPNELKWTKTETEWGGFPKIKSVAWRNCAY